MIQTRIIPVATATTQELLVEITEAVCKPYCVNSSNQPTASVSFEVGTAQLINGSTVVPIVAKVTVLSPYKDCGCATPQVYTERFDIAFESTGTNTVTLAEGASTSVTPAYVRCCKARGVRIVTTLTATIA